MHEAVRQGDAQGNSPDGTVEHARVAMPAFFGELDAGEFVDAAVKDEKVRIADFGTSAASGTLLCGMFCIYRSTITALYG